MNALRTACHVGVAKLRNGTEKIRAVSGGSERVKYCVLEMRKESLEGTPITMRGE
jgi:hypothetical protein